MFNDDEIYGGESFFLSNFSVYLFSKKILFDFYRKMRKFRQDKNQKGKIG